MRPIAIGGVVLIYAALLVLLALYARKHPETVSTKEALLPDLSRLRGQEDAQRPVTTVPPGEAFAGVLCRGHACRVDR